MENSKNSKLKRPLPKGVILRSARAKKVFSGVRNHVFQWEQKMFDGTTEVFEVLKRNDSVVIYPIIDDEIVLIRERQPHWKKSGITSPAGNIEPDEDIYDAARRELEEETGMVFKNIYLVSVDQIAPNIEWFRYTFIATDLQSTKALELDRGEKIKPFRVSIEKYLQMVRERKFVYHPIFVEDFLVRNKVGKLKKIFARPEKFQIK